MFGMDRLERPQPLKLSSSHVAIMTGLIRSGNPSPAQIKRLVDGLYDSHVGSENVFLHILQRTLDMAMTIDQVKVGKFGVKHPTHISNRIIGCFISEAVRRMDARDDELANLQKVKNAFASEEGVESWFTPKVDIMTELFKNKLGTIEWTENLTMASAEQSLELLHADIPALDQTIRDTMAELLQLRKYGVKTCYFQDGIIHDQQDAWIFFDYMEVSGLLKGERFADPGKRYLALISLSPKKLITDLNLSKRVVSERGWQVTRSELPNKGYYLWAIDEEGELWIFSAYAPLSVREIFAAQGKEVEYELLRLSHVMRLYDLTVPITVVSEMPSLPRQKSTAGGIVSRLGSLIGKGMLITPDLIIPRIRKIQDHRHILDEIIKEVERSQEETQKRAPHRKHELGAFVRLLPKGHKPSAEARERAMKDGIELADNETYVKKHSRGSGEPVGIPRARRRKR